MYLESEPNGGRKKMEEERSQSKERRGRVKSSGVEEDRGEKNILKGKFKNVAVEKLNLC